MGIYRTVNYVLTSEIADNAVTTAKILDKNVTGGKLEDAGAEAQILVANASKRLSPVAMGGDVSIVATGAVTIGNDAVTTPKILDEAITVGKMANGAFNEMAGTIDTARADLSYAGFCFVEPTPSWMSLFQILGKMGNLEAKADEAYTNASLVAA